MVSEMMGNYGRACPRGLGSGVHVRCSLRYMIPIPGRGRWVERGCFRLFISRCEFSCGVAAISVGRCVLCFLCLVERSLVSWRPPPTRVEGSPMGATSFEAHRPLWRAVALYYVLDFLSVEAIRFILLKVRRRWAFVVTKLLPPLGGAAISRVPWER